MMSESSTQLHIKCLKNSRTLNKSALCEETANKARRTKAQDSTRASMLETDASNAFSDAYAEIRIQMPWGHIAGRWYGDQSQRPILALHGWLDNCGSFAKLAPILATQCSLLCIDLPGHGRSSHLPAGIIYDMMSFVRVIRRIMLIYNWPKVALLGHSFGAYLSFIFASIHPQCVDMLISLDLIKMLYMPEDAFLGSINYTIERTLRNNEQMPEPPTYTYERCIQLLYEGSDKSIDLDNCAYLLARNINKSKKYPEKYYFAHDLRLKELLVFNPNAILTAEMARRITSAKLPHLLLQGGATKNAHALANETAYLMQAQNTNFAQYVIAEGTHHLHLNNAEEVGAHIMRFLKRHQLIETEVNENINQKAKSKPKKSKL